MKMTARFLLISLQCLMLAMSISNIAYASGSLYGRSYALVVGINEYQNSHWMNLRYAVKDAESIASYLTDIGFDVITLYDSKATKEKIIEVLQDNFAPILKENDRVLVFFSGHGHTQPLGGEDAGFIVPYDGTDRTSSYISMSALAEQSGYMRKAKHQLFIMDSCYGGMLGAKSSFLSADTIPNYLEEIASRQARLILTAGGKDQQVLDGGSGGHSIFVDYLLKGLREGDADSLRDGFITFSEIYNYVQGAAWSRQQTPGFNTLPGHQSGEFLFPSPHDAVGVKKPIDPGNSGFLTKGVRESVEKLRTEAKIAYQNEDFTKCFQLFLKAAEMGDLESMYMIGLFYYHGKGVVENLDQSFYWLNSAAERGHLKAMQNLALCYRHGYGVQIDPTMADYWENRYSSESDLFSDLAMSGPTKPSKDQTTIKDSDLQVKPPSPPTGLRIQ